MQCMVCGHDNASGANFCSQCGSPLSRRCPVCANDVEADARFCSNCGTIMTGESDADDDLSRYVPETLLRKIRAARASGTMRGERRTVTMLFADIEGSTAAAEQLDPEEWADIVNGAFAQLIAPVYRYEGTLARLQGDAVLAFFGAPIAHEDDPVRAVHAGLEMLAAIRGHADEVRARLDVPIAVRIGINTGLVVVGEVGSDLRVEYTALGDAINVAARMEQTAEPGTVRITEETARLLGDAFVTTTIGPVAVKGRADPVVALRVEAVAAAAPAPAAPAPMVGRERERAALGTAVDQALAGIGAVVTVVGEAGLGKSRLLAALRDDLSRGHDVALASHEPGEVAWLEGHCRSFDTAVPYAPFLDLAQRWLDLPALPRDALYDRIAEVVDRARGVPDPDVTAYLANLAGGPLPETAQRLVAALDAPALHDKTTAAVVSYLEAEASRRPMVLVLDDLHWADALSLVLAERLMASTDRVPIVLVLAMRPARDDPSWRLVEVASREAAHRHTPIELGTLAPDDTEALLELLLEERSVAGDARRRILDRAGGNPLFVEEIVRALDDDEVSEVPSSLTGLLTARLDRLEESTRYAAEVAAVVGGEFDADAVASLVDDIDVDAALADLVRHGIVTEKRRVPQRRYVFRHALIHETAYATILLKDRRALHGRLARHLVATGADVPHEIARHFLTGGERTEAFPWLVDAGRRAVRSMSLAEAIRLLSTALEHSPPGADPDVVAQAHLALGEAYSLIPDLGQAAAAYQELVAFGRACELPTVQVAALNRLGVTAALNGGDFEAAGRYLEDARALAETAGDESGLAEYHVNSCFVAVASGELDRAVGHDRATAEIAGAIGDDLIRVQGLVRAALNLVAATRFDEAVDAVAEAREAAVAGGFDEQVAIVDAQCVGRLRLREGEVRAGLELTVAATEVLDRYGSAYTSITHGAVGGLALLLGDVETALARFGEAARFGERRAQPFVVAAAAAGLAHGYALCGDADAGAGHRARALEALGEAMGDMFASTVWADLAAANLALERWDDAEADIALGLEASSSSRYWERPRLLAAASLVALEQGQPGRATALVEEAAAYVDARDLEVFRPVLAYASGTIARSDGDLEAAERWLAEADDGAARMELALLAIDIARARADISAGRGRDIEAAGHRERRAVLVRELSGLIADPGLRQGFTRRLEEATTLPDDRA